MIFIFVFRSLVSIYTALSTAAVDADRAMFLADLRDKDLIIKYVLNWEFKKTLERAPLFLIITQKNRVVLPKVLNYLNDNRY